MSETLCFHSVFTNKALLWLTLLSPHFFQLQNEVQITSKFLPALNIVYDVLSFSEDRAVACTPNDGSQCGYINSEYRLLSPKGVCPLSYSLFIKHDLLSVGHNLP